MKILIVTIVSILAIIFFLMWCNDEVCDYSICDVLSHYCGLHKDESVVENNEVKEVDTVIKSKG